MSGWLLSNPPLIEYRSFRISGQFDRLRKFLGISVRSAAGNMVTVGGIEMPSACAPGHGGTIVKFKTVPVSKSKYPKTELIHVDEISDRMGNARPLIWCVRWSAWIAAAEQCEALIDRKIDGVTGA